MLFLSLYLIDTEYPVLVLALHDVECMVPLNFQSLFAQCTFYSHISVLYTTTGKVKIFLSYASAQKVEQTYEAVVAFANRPAVA